MPKGVPTAPAIRQQFEQRIASGESVAAVCQDLELPIQTGHKWRWLARQGQSRLSQPKKVRRLDPVLKGKFFRRVEAGESVAQVCRDLGLPVHTGYNLRYFQKKTAKPPQDGQVRPSVPSTAPQVRSEVAPLGVDELAQVRAFLAERRQRPSSKTARTGKTTMVRLDSGLLAALKDKATELHLPMSECLAQAVEQWLAG